MEISSIDFLARLLGELKRSFDAEVIDARDDFDGGIVVDVRLDASKALKQYRVLVLEQAGRTVLRSRALLETNLALQQRAVGLLEEVRAVATANRDMLFESRAIIAGVRTLRLPVVAPRPGVALDPS